MASRILQVPRGAHGDIIGHGGATIKGIQSKHGVSIVMPAKTDSTSCAVIVSGPSTAAIDAAEAEIEAIVGFKIGTEPLQTTVLAIESDEHGRLIGKGGATLKELEKANCVNIDIPRGGGSGVTVQGTPAAVHNAVAAIESLLKHKVHISGSAAAAAPAKPVTVDFTPDVSEALFFRGDPDNDTANFNRFLSFIASAKRTANVAVFNLTDDRIANTLISLHANGVKVRLITDNDTAAGEGSDTMRLRAAGIPVRMDSTPACMHHKFAVLDDACLLNGSFNWTRSAATTNNENIVISGNAQLIAAFNGEFERLWARFA